MRGWGKKTMRANTQRRGADSKNGVEAAILQEEGSKAAGALGDTMRVVGNRSVTAKLGDHGSASLRWA